MVFLSFHRSLCLRSSAVCHSIAILPFTISFIRTLSFSYHFPVNLAENGVVSNLVPSVIALPHCPSELPRLSAPALLSQGNPQTGRGEIIFESRSFVLPIFLQVYDHIMKIQFSKKWCNSLLWQKCLQIKCLFYCIEVLSEASWLAENVYTLNSHFFWY